MHIYPDALAVVRDLRPDEPVILNRPHAARRAADFLQQHLTSAEGGLYRACLGHTKKMLETGK